MKTRNTARCGARHLTAPPIRKGNSPGRERRLETARHREVWESCSHSSARYGNVTGRVSGAASKTDGRRKSLGIKTSRFRQLMRGSGEAPRESHKLQTSEHFGAAQPNTGDANKDVLVPSPRCKRGPFGQGVRFSPSPTNCGRSSKAELLVANEMTPDRYRPAAPNSPRKLIW